MNIITNLLLLGS